MEDHIFEVDPESFDTAMAEVGDIEALYKGLEVTHEIKIGEATALGRWRVVGGQVNPPDSSGRGAHYFLRYTRVSDG